MIYILKISLVADRDEHGVPGGGFVWMQLTVEIAKSSERQLTGHHSAFVWRFTARNHKTKRVTTCRALRAAGGRMVRDDFDLFLQGEKSRRGRWSNPNARDTFQRQAEVILCEALVNQDK